MSTYIDIKPSGRLEVETRDCSPTSTEFTCSLKIECPVEDDVSTKYYNPLSIKGIKEPSHITAKQFPAHIERARRRCLTQMPCNMVRDSILPAHISTMLSPARQDPEHGFYAEARVTPTKEMVMELLASSPRKLTNKSYFSDSIAKPAFSKFNKLPNLVSDAHTLSNQLTELAVSSNQSGKNPAKRRVRATYGVRLETIRVGFEPDTNTRKCHSQDEYQSTYKEGVKLAPIARAGQM